MVTAVLSVCVFKNSKRLNFLCSQFSIEDGRGNKQRFQHSESEVKVKTQLERTESLVQRTDKVR